MHSLSGDGERPPATVGSQSKPGLAEPSPEIQALRDLNEGLARRLGEAEAVLASIRAGEVDALVVEGSAGDRVFTLSGSDQVYRIVIEAMSEGAFTVSNEGTILYANEAAARLLGVPAAQLVGGRFGDRVDPGERGRYEALLRRSVAAASRDELIVVAADGRRIPVILSVSDLLAHAIPALCIIATDLTEQKRSQELMEVRERLELAQAAGRIGVFEWDAVNGAVHWTRELEALYGLAPGSFEGTYEAWFQRIHPADRGAVERALADALSTPNGCLDLEFRVLWPDGGVRYVAAKGQVHGAAGGPQRMIGVNVDITRRKQAESEVEQQARELARSNADLQNFATVASHDLQEPLRMISSYLSLLERRLSGQLDEKARVYIDHARGGAVRMSAMIRALLAYSSLNAKPIEPTRVPLASALQDALDNLHQQITACAATVHHDDLPVVVADPFQIARVFQNLIANGLKFCRGRAPEIRVTARREAGAWVISVRDKGIGIDPRFQDRLFGMFQRLHPQGEFGGSGIGLASCKRIIERHGGLIWVESILGEGSCFSFSLPDAAAV
jgi:PAS domain S-box-containing protein